MKYLVEFQPIGQVPRVALQEVDTITDGCKVISEHMQLNGFAAEMRGCYNIATIIEPWHEVRLSPVWCIQQMVVERDGNRVTLHGKPYVNKEVKEW